MDCLAEDTIVAFVQGTLPADGVCAVEAHMDVCGDCRLLVAELARTSLAEGPAGDELDEVIVDEDLSLDDEIGHRPTQPYRQVERGAEPEELDTDPLAHRARSSRGSSRGSSSFGAGLVADQPLRAGELLAERYRVGAFLGAGAMGAVYEAHDLQLDEPVAIKILRPELSNHRELLDRLHAEVVLGRRITHPNICRLHDICAYREHHFITMELVRGETLDTMLTRGRPRTRVALSVLLQICSALDAAHQKGVVHRDLKPGNIMLDWNLEPTAVLSSGYEPRPEETAPIEGGKITVMDFGLARDLRGDRSQSGMLIGSPAYWSPEQARGDRATERSDIYAVGVIACELLGAPRPQLGKPGRLTEIPAAFRSVIRRCLAVDPGDRFATAGALRDAVVAAVRVAPTRRRLGWTAVAAVVVVLAAVGSYFGLSLLSNKHTSLDQPSLAGARPSTSPPASRPLGAVSRPAAARETTADPAATVDTKTRAAASSVAEPRRTTSRPRRRVAPRRRLARQPTSSKEALAVVPPPPADPEPKPRVDPAAARQAEVLETVQRRVAAIEQNRRARGLLVEDPPGYAPALDGVRRALRGKDAAAARAALDRLAIALGKAQVDRQLIGRKLARLNKQRSWRKLDPATDRKVRGTFAKVHNRYFAGDYAAANKHLNTIWRLLKTTR